jgi:hypothetical protein
MGTPLHLSAAETLAAFRAGWSHNTNGGDASGYYIGRCGWHTESALAFDATAAISGPQLGA